MEKRLSERLAAIVAALPLHEDLRVLEIGCGPGAMARAMASLMRKGYVLGIDRSAKAIKQAITGSAEEIRSGKLSFRQVSVEAFDLKPGEKPFDVAVAIRVGALDGRHPEAEKQALHKIARALKKEGKLYIDGGNPLKEVPLQAFRK